MKAVWRTHIGKVRKSNQDALLVEISGFPLYAVADGMGGHRGGDIASVMAIDSLKTHLTQQIPSTKSIDSCFQTITKAIFDRQKQDDHLSGMGTTLTLLWETSDLIYMGHVGDSRAYLLREGLLMQKSEDHSLVGDLLRRGAIDLAAARNYPYRNVVTRAVGTEDKVLCDTAVFDKKPKDRWLLCSDGLTEHLDLEEIYDCLILEDMDEAADLMIVQALKAGGRDNITVILLEVGA